MSKDLAEFKKRESLRCLFASVRSVTVLERLIEIRLLGRVYPGAEPIDEELENIQTFFLAQSGLSRKEAIDRTVPMGSPLMVHIYEVLFADAIRWWAAAHRVGREKNKYLRPAMYGEGYDGLWYHFYHEFRNNQLAHYPGGLQSNDGLITTPRPYGFLLSRKEFEDFQSILAYSIRILLFGEERARNNTVDWDAVRPDGLPKEFTSQLDTIWEEMTKNPDVRREIDKNVLKMPTRNYFPPDGANHAN